MPCCPSFCCFPSVCQVKSSSLLSFLAGLSWITSLYITHCKPWRLTQLPFTYFWAAMAGVTHTHTSTYPIHHPLQLKKKKKNSLFQSAFKFVFLFVALLWAVVSPVHRVLRNTFVRMLGFFPPPSIQANQSCFIIHQLDTAPYLPAAKRTERRWKEGVRRIVTRKQPLLQSSCGLTPGDNRIHFQRSVAFLWAREKDRLR